MSKDPGDYEVGYKKPPVEHQFQTGGKRGNKKGRHKKSANFKTDLRAELATPIVLKINGRPAKMTQQRAVVKSLLSKGLNGNVSALSKAIDIIIRVFGTDDDPQCLEALTPEDQAILDAILNRGSGDDGGE